MTRPRKKRYCRRYQADRVYKPQGIPMKGLKETILSLDQFEVLCLCDVDNLDQDDAGRKMGVSRGTIQRILYKARKQLVEAIINNNAIIINLKESEDCHVGMHPHKRQCRSTRGNK